MNFENARAALAALVCLALPAAAQDVETLYEEFSQHARDLIAEIDVYSDSRSREDAALGEYVEVNRRLDELLGQVNASPDELNNLEAALDRARESLLFYSQESASSRVRFYQGMDELSDTGRRLQGMGVSATSDAEGLTGSWRLEAMPMKVIGLMSMQQRGGQVSGEYRLGNGARGTVRGRLVGNDIRLELLDDQGTVADLEGSLNAASTDARGSWRARELASGLPSTGEWSAQRISLQQAIAEAE